MRPWPIYSIGCSARTSGTHFAPRSFSEIATDCFRSAAKRGIANADVERHNGTVRFASIDALISTERACVWTLGGMLDDSQFAQLLAEAGQALRPFVGADGAIAFDMPALVVTASKQ